MSVERETFPGLLAAGARVSGHVDDAYWRDMGTPADLVHGSADLVRGVAPSDALPGPDRGGVAAGRGRGRAEARMFGGSTVGRGARIGPGARVDGRNGVRRGRDRPGRGRRARRDRRRAPGSGTAPWSIDSVIGDRAVVGEHCELRAGVRVWPDVVLPAARGALLHRRVTGAAISGPRWSGPASGGPAYRLDLSGVLAPLRRGRGDPTFRSAGQGAAVGAPAPPRTAPAHAAAAPAGRRHRGRRTAWGPGAEWALAGLPGLLGARRPAGGVRARTTRWSPTRSGGCRACGSAPPGGCGTCCCPRCWSRR